MSVQKSDFLGLGMSPKMDSNGRLGSGGTEESTLALDVGKYMVVNEEHGTFDIPTTGIDIARDV